ncbi:hypothetical protein PHISCL_02289 [Aspergillus sclerotialis]|uniref:Uncharacterized protein n=1 Tax=Aspergillus sclerotialis TaxID=2070753 RepID=A0A3A2ZQG4_9EURO|nr:hypothetical protein PHISCL_02289 [Aspergillus sclerotialis]
MLGSFLHLIILATARVTGQSSHFAKPQCSALTGPWCSCPSGTTLQQSTTWATLSADVKDVHAVAGRCKELYPRADFGLPDDMLTAY